LQPGSGATALSPGLGNTKSAKEETQKAQIDRTFLCAFCVGFAHFVFPWFFT
jgi:hypothetical protein